MKVSAGSYTQAGQTTIQSAKLVIAAASCIGCNVTQAATASAPAGGVRLSSADA